MRNHQHTLLRRVTPIRQYAKYLVGTGYHGICYSGEDSKQTDPLRRPYLYRKRINCLFHCYRSVSEIIIFICAILCNTGFFVFCTLADFGHQKPDASKLMMLISIQEKYSSESVQDFGGICRLNYAISHLLEILQKY